MAQAVITRSSDEATAYAAALAELGLETVAMPVTRTESIDSGLDRVLRERQYQAIAVASARAARALVDAWLAPARADGRIAISTWYEMAYGNPPEPDKPTFDAAGHAELPLVWAVGAATGRVLADAGLAHRVEGGDGAALAAVMIEALGSASRSPVLAGKRILVPRAAGGRPELLERLVDVGATVDAISVYRTIELTAADPDVAAGQDALMCGPEICVVMAPSQVTSLDTMLPIGTIDTTFVAIGETTAEALRAAGARRVVVATEPTPEGIAKAARAVYPPKP
jgi:uroporphyrinogen-III synthase